MALPKLKTPLFDVTIPSTGKDAKFRPFLVKEEKILLMAQAAGDKKSIINALQQILNNCMNLNDGSKLDVNTLTTFDIEYIFLKIRAKSVDNMVELTYTDNEDNKEYKFKVSLDDIDVQRDKNHSNKIKVTDEVGLILRYPTATEINAIDDKLSFADISVEIVKTCIEKIYDAETVYETKESTNEEMQEFVDHLTVKAYEEVNKFVETMPKMYHKIEYKNSKGTDRVIELTTLEDFFTLV
jgi:hypothetical protein